MNLEIKKIWKISLLFPQGQGLDQILDETKKGVDKVSDNGHAMNKWYKTILEMLYCRKEKFSI